MSSHLEEKLRLDYKHSIPLSKDKMIYPDRDYYQEEEDRIKESTDRLFGITRTVQLNADRKKYPTGAVVYRDATKALPIDNLESSVDIERNNIKLRVLGRLRSIDYVLQKKVKEQVHATIYAKLIEQLKTGYINFNEDCDTLEDLDALLKLEERFNTNELCRILHEAHLDEGCSNPKDYKELLFHYRNLTALISPARSLVTVSYDEKNQVVHRITQHPITQKTPTQKEQIKRKMKATRFAPLPSEINFQTSQPMCMQMANYYFAELAASDDRMLGAQARKTHLHGLKNAFFVKNELIFADQKGLQLFEGSASEEDTQCFIRSATPVYVGDGELDKKIHQATRENLSQARRFAEKQLGQESLRLHVTCLVTDSPLENQHTMIRHTYGATRDIDPKGHLADVSYIPCNFDGTFRSPDLSQFVTERPQEDSAIFNQTGRYHYAAQVSNHIRSKPNIVEFVACASGQDRTETESEYATQAWVRSRYRAKHKVLEGPTRGDIVERTRAKSRNSAEINAHTVAGARGCKNDSRGHGLLLEGSLYSSSTERAMYLKSADQVIKNHINKNSIKEMMGKPSSIAVAEYDYALNQLNSAIQQTKFPLLKQAGISMKTEIVSARAKVKPKDLGTLTRFTLSSAAVVRGPVDQSLEARKEYAKRISQLASSSQKCDNKSIFKKVGFACLALLGIALVVAGILLVIPSGSSSLLLCALGAKALLVGSSLKAAASTGIIVGAGSAMGNGVKAHTQIRHGIEKRYGLFSAANQLKDAVAKEQKFEAKSKLHPS